MKYWDELRTAFHVARCGTVSGAAVALNVHHTTVIRHIDTLEEHLKQKLFQRHSRGYTPTEAGLEMLRVAQATDDQLKQLENRLRDGGNELGGEVVITSVQELSFMLTPMLAQFQAKHPSFRIRYLTGERLYRLEYGEAHVAIRAGEDAPRDPDNVVQRFCDFTVGLFAAPSYIEQFGAPIGDAEFHSHRFVIHDDETNRAPHYAWLHQHVTPQQIVFRSSDTGALFDAIIAGMGIGYLNPQVAEKYGMLPVAGALPLWDLKLWLVTHVDLHRSPKVQALVRYLKENRG